MEDDVVTFLLGLYTFVCVLIGLVWLQFRNLHLKMSVTVSQFTSKNECYSFAIKIKNDCFTYQLNQYLHELFIQNFRLR